MDNVTEWQDSGSESDDRLTAAVDRLAERIEQNQRDLKKFQRELEQKGVVDDLKRLRLWRGDGKRLRDGERGFTLQDLFSFSRAITREVFDPQRAIDDANTIRNFVGLLSRQRLATTIQGVPMDIALDLAREMVGQFKSRKDSVLIIGDLKSWLRRADELEKAGRVPKKRGRPTRTTAERVFVESWAAFAKKRSGSYLDEIGYKLLAIAFRRVLDMDSYVKFRREVSKRPPSLRRPNSGMNCMLKRG